MALYINQEKQAHHVGAVIIFPVEQVQFVQVDGDELDRVISWGFPNSKKRVQWYFGDQAKYIIANW